LTQSDHYSCFHWCLVKTKVINCNHQRYGWLLEKILKTESLTWGNGKFDLSHANKNEQLESCCRPGVDFGAQGIKTMKQSRPVFRSKRTQKSIKRTQKSPNELKFQKVYVCDFHIFLVYGQNGVKAPRLMRNVVKHARCSGSTATYKLKHYTNNIIAYNCYVGVIWWMRDPEKHRFSPKRSYRSILIQTHQKSEQTQTLKIQQDFEAPGK
jgi:hypothetical protein